MILILDNIRSAYNVGALFRTADGAGVEHIYLVGITPKPAKLEQLYLTLAEKTLKKTALGAEVTVSWSHHQTLVPLLRRLKKENCEILALEEGEKIMSTDYRSWRAKRRGDTVLILGNEVTGLDPKVLTLADHVLHLPMRGTKNSLNVSVAGSIALYHLSDTIEKLNPPDKKNQK